MSTTKLERESLEAHVDLCAIRYDNLDKRLSNVETKLDDISEDMKQGQNSLSKVIIGAAGTIVASLLSIVIVLLMQ
jgi:predicted  nucleic acid-binding Zn-ribbon protein